MFISDEDARFLKKQKRVALRHCGIVDPTSIDDYIQHDGYKALDKALHMTPEEVIEEIKVSGLAGRGGAGFPTWFKWNAARQAEGENKHLICNADEGHSQRIIEPGRVLGALLRPLPELARVVSRERHNVLL